MTNRNDFEVLSTIIKSRRSIFPPVFSEEIIADKLIVKILENANWAPNHKKTEPWRFHVIGGASRNKLSELAGDWYQKNFTGDAYKEVKHKKIKSNPIKSSHVIALCVQYDPEERVPQWEEEAAVSCAIQNLWLSVSAAGLGGYWSSPKYIGIMCEMLDMKEGESCIGLFYLGIPQDGFSSESSRGPIEDKVTWYR